MSERRGDEIHIETEDASGGSRQGVVRYVLGISLLAAIVLLSAIWIFGAATQGDTEEEMTVAGARADGETEERGGGGILPEEETLDPDRANPQDNR